jgi:hypothetical protein
MSTITYKCSVCKRTIEKLENTDGLTVFSKCIITDGCRGKLQKTSRNQSSIRESFPLPETGLTDFFPRRVFYEHSQPIPSRIWKVFHNLSVNPEVSVWEDNDGLLKEIDQDEYTVSNVSTDQLSITFDSAKSGVSHCIAKTSVPIKPKLISTEIPPVRSTENGTVVFAVPEIITDSIDPGICSAPFYTRDTNLRVLVEVIKPNEEAIVCPEEIDGDLLNTSWSGWDRSLVRNRRHYTLKAKNILEFRAFSDIRTSNEDIPNGTVIRFLGVDYGDVCDPEITDNDLRFRDIPSRGLFVFLANEPFQSIDKIRDKLIDTGEMIGTEENFFVYSNGDLYTSTENIENTYPDIKQAVIPPVPTPTPTPTNSPLVCTLIGTDFANPSGVVSDLEFNNGAYAYFEIKTDGTYTYVTNDLGLSGPPEQVIEIWSIDTPNTNSQNYEVKWEFDGPPDSEALLGYVPPLDEGVWGNISSDLLWRQNFGASISCDLRTSIIITIRDPNIPSCEYSKSVELYYYDENCA